jgi:beta-lactamase class A
MTSTLYDELRQLIQDSRVVEVGLAARRLADGEEILIAPDSSFHPASTIKICVMMEVFRQARQGVFSLDDQMAVKNEFSSAADGSNYSLNVDDDAEKDLYGKIGQTLPIRNITQRMITMSSNLGTNLLIERVTPEGINRFMQELGTDGLLVRRGIDDTKAFRLGLNNAASARGLMQILVKLAGREVVSTGHSDEMIEILCQQHFNEMIPAQLPGSVRVAHKTGWDDDFHHDAGIVYPPQGSPFVLAILTKGLEKDEVAHPFVASLAKAVYDGFMKP